MAWYSFYILTANKKFANNMFMTRLFLYVIICYDHYDLIKWNNDIIKTYSTSYTTQNIILTGYK